jgi:hypothetical protein
MATPVRALDPVARRDKPPHCYLWSALWWRKEASRGYPCSERSRSYSRNQLQLFRDMLARPEHYRRKPKGTTDWQWMQIGLDAL